MTDCAYVDKMLAAGNWRGGLDFARRHGYCVIVHDTQTGKSYDVTYWSVIAVGKTSLTLTDRPLTPPVASIYQWNLDTVSIFVSRPGVYRMADEDTQTAEITLPADPKAKAPKNNDGRDHCWWCGGVTKQVDVGTKFFDICKDCEK